MRDANCGCDDAMCEMRGARCDMIDARCKMENAKCKMQDKTCGILVQMQLSAWMSTTNIFRSFDSTETFQAIS
jgi:hypothetical protein